AAALTSGPVDGMPLERRLEIARHLREGGTECLLASAEVHYGLARDAAMDGLSFAEAERHCEEVIKAVHDLPQQESRDRWLIQAVELLLSLTEVRWRGQHRPTGGPDIDALAAEAEAAAKRCGSPGPAIRTTLLRGKTLLATQGLVPSLEKLREAVELAERHGDPVALFVARVEYGRQVSKRRLADGLAQLLEAERMYASAPRLGDRADPVLQHARNLGEMQLGITLFDSGHLSDALTRLTRCVQRLRDEPLKAELPIALNYLAQVHTGVGSYRDAEEVLREALDFEAGRGGDSGWHAYNKALLAHLLFQRPASRDQALELIADAWAETERTWLANLVPIVRNLYGEILLLASDASGQFLDQADRLAVTTCVETRRSGMIRSEIAAHSLRSRVLLRQGDTAGALDQARQAVRILDEVGDMPALRTEEVLYRSAVVQAAGGVRTEALALLDRARREVARKADMITDDSLRDRFLTQVPLNSAILDGEGIGR
ncbi:ATP-binding protein, partial [Streptomyces prunicolor]